jgi:hypothetical protein
VTPLAWVGIGVITVTVIYTIIRFLEDGNLEKGTLAILLGGTLVGILILYFFYPPFYAFVWNLLFYKQ